MCNYTSSHQIDVRDSFIKSHYISNWFRLSSSAETRLQVRTLCRGKIAL